MDNIYTIIRRTCVDKPSHIDWDAADVTWYPALLAAAVAAESLNAWEAARRLELLAKSLRRHNDAKLAQARSESIDPQPTA